MSYMYGQQLQLTSDNERERLLTSNTYCGSEVLFQGLYRHEIRG